MAAKKLPAKKASPTKKSEPTQGLAKSKKAKVDKKSQAGDLASERTVMRNAAQSNRQARKETESFPTGLVTVSYRDKGGKLKNTTVNRRFGASMPSSNYLFFGKPKKK